MGHMKKGDKFSSFSASKWNKLDEVIDAFKKGDAPSSADDNSARDGIILVRNQTGSNRAIADVVGLKSPIITSSFAAFALGLEFDGVLPTDGSGDTDDYTGKFAIYLVPCPAGDTAPALVIGLTAAKLSMQTASDGYADIYPGDPSKLKSGSSGAAQIIWAASASSYPADVYGMVRLANKSAASDDSVPCKNISEHTVPPFGIMQVVDVLDEDAAELTLTITRPEADCGSDKYIINGESPIAPGATGKGYWRMPHRIAYDPVDSDNDDSDEMQWGPKPGSFLARSGPVYWEKHGIGPTVSGTHTLWVGPAHPQSYMFFTPEETEEHPDGIPAATYTGGVITPGYRVLKVWEFNGDGQLVETEQEEVVYQIYTSAVEPERLIQAKQERRTGRLIVDVRPCDPLEETESEGG